MGYDYQKGYHRGISGKPRLGLLDELFAFESTKREIKRGHSAGVRHAKRNEDRQARKNAWRQKNGR